MKTIGIFYGSSTGTTEGIAKRIAEKLGVEDKDIHDVSNASPADVAPYEILLLGCSTWGAGDLQDDWDSYLGKLKKLDLSEKTVALFGCGDSASFSDTFCDAIGTIYSALLFDRLHSFHPEEVRRTYRLCRRWNCQMNIPRHLQRR